MQELRVDATSGRTGLEPRAGDEELQRVPRERSDETVEEEGVVVGEPLSRVDVGAGIAVLHHVLRREPRVEGRHHADRRQRDDRGGTHAGTTEREDRA